MEVTELELILNDILTKTKELIKKGKRDDILNERFFHHMFSNLIASYFFKKNMDIWGSLLLVPERPTKKKFYWKGIKLEDIEYTKKHAIDKGQSGQYDFAIINNQPPIFFEWKGPDLCATKDIAQVMLKLLSEDKDKSSLKIFAMIITSSKRGSNRHINAIKEHLRTGLKFSLKVLEINKLEEKNLYVYVATLPDTDNGCVPIPIHWGKCSQKINFLTQNIKKEKK